MDKEILGTMIPMLLFKKEIYDFVENLIKERTKKSQEKVLYSIEEASKILNLKVSRLRQAVFRREINHVKLGALVRFREEDLQCFISNNAKTFNKT